VSEGARYASNHSARRTSPTSTFAQRGCPRRYLIIADQVFELYRLLANVHVMLRPGGHFLVTTPFLVRIHDVPYDCLRWTPLGLKHLLAKTGFPIEKIKAWFRSLRNEEAFPVAVWALAQRD
jgi:hypothetical protein